MCLFYGQLLEKIGLLLISPSGHTGRPDTEMASIR